MERTPTMLVVCAVLALCLGGGAATAATINVANWTGIQAAINGASAGDTIQLATGTYTTTSGITINKAVIVDGGGSTIDVSGSGWNVVRIVPGGAGATLRNITINKTDNTGEHNLVYIQANNVSILNNTFRGQWVYKLIGSEPTTRAFEIAYNCAGLLIDGNTFEKLRHPGYINPGCSGVISNNHQIRGRGWVVLGDYINFTGNSWSTTTGSNINIEASVPFGYPWDPISDLRARNNNASVTDKRSSGGVPPLTPQLTQLTPNWALQGSGGFTLTVTGTGFVDGAVVRWAGSERTTVFVDATELTAEIAASDLAAAGQRAITVFNKVDGGGASGSLPFTVQSVPSVVWVDDDWDGPTNCGGHTWQYDAFAVIQHGVNAVAVGGTVNVAAGAYAESVSINKRLTLAGAGSDPAGTRILPNAGPSILLTAGGATEAERITFRDIRLTSPSNGISITTNVSHLTIDNVSSVSCGASGLGMDAATQGLVTDVQISNSSFSGNAQMGISISKRFTVDGLTVTGSHFDDNRRGLYAQSLDNSQYDTTFTNVTFTNCSFDRAWDKAGIWLEKLNNATFTNCTVNDSGQAASTWMAGVDLNLKHRDYQNITFDNVTISNSGTGDPVNGAGIAIKARDDGSYAAYPATLTGVQLRNMTITGCVDGVRLGEPGALNATPVNVTISGCTFSGNSLSDVRNCCAQGNVVDARGNTWGNGATTDAEIEDRVWHDVDQAGIGHVDWGQGGATPTNLSVQNVSGTKGATVQLAARLTAGGSALAGQAVNISVDGTAVGAPVTDSNGWARINYTITQNAGSFNIDAAFAGVFNYRAVTGRGTLTVTTPAPTSITVTVAPNPVTAGQTSTATVMGSNGVDYSAAATCYIQYGAGGSWAGNVYTSAKAGTWTVTAVYGSLAATTTLTVNHGAASSVTLAPITASITTDQTQTYTVQATDAQGNSWTPAVGAILWTENGAGAFNDMTYEPEAADGGNVVTITATVDGQASNAAALTVISSGSGGTPLILAWDKDTATFYLCTDAANPQTGTALALGDNTVGTVTVTVSKVGSSSTDLIATVSNAGAPANALQVRWYLRSGVVDKCYSYSTISGTTHTAVYSLGRTAIDGGRSQVGFFGLAHNLNADPPTGITYSVVQQP